MTAAECLTHGRIKSSGTDKDIFNSEEVIKELSDATKRNHGQSLRLWKQYVNRQMPRTNVPTDSRPTDILIKSWRHMSAACFVVTTMECATTVACSDLLFFSIP